jgi:hypothetical protein
LITVVTALFGGRLELLEPGFASADVAFVAFTDDPDVRSRWWTVKLVPRDSGTTPRRQAKRYKVLPHEYLPHSEYSLWIDSDVSLAVDPNDLVARHLKDSDLALFTHPWRDCIYDEAEVCADIGLDSPERIRRQIERYRSEGYPPRNGLHACRILLRRHTPAIRALNEAWWAEITRDSVRDQISFGYVCWRLGVAVRLLPGMAYENPFFRYRPQPNPPPPEPRIAPDL